MLKWLLPQTTDFFDLFEQHAAQTVKAAQVLQLLLTDGANVETYAERIREIEHAADTITHRCMEALHKTFITPFEREQIHQLITNLDDIVDYIEDAAARILLYKIVQVTPEAVSLSSLLVGATEEVERALKNMRHLKNTDSLQRSFIRINRLENEADIVVRQALGRLFDEEHDPCSIIKWKEVYEHLENAMDACEHVANIIEGVILESD